MCGEEASPPLVLFHGVGDDSALMWLYNAKELAKHFRVYAIDTMGGPGKSCPNENHTKNFDCIKWLDVVFEKLHLERFYIAGVSNGAYITQHYGIMRTDKVIKMICMAGSVYLDNGSPLKRMFKVFLPEALFPTKKNLVKLIKKITGYNWQVFTNNSELMEHFTYLMRGFNLRAMTYHKMVYFNESQLNSICGKVLFLCGESDPLGDADIVRNSFDKYHLDYRFFPSVGHGINHEISEEINEIIIDYFIMKATVI